MVLCLYLLLVPAPAVYIRAGPCTSARMDQEGLHRMQSQPEEYFYLYSPIFFTYKTSIVQQPVI